MAAEGMTAHASAFAIAMFATIPAGAQQLPTAAAGQSEHSIAGQQEAAAAPRTERDITPLNADQDKVSGDIVVTAQRRSERLQDVPVAVTAFDTRALEQRGATNLADVSAYVPSLQIHSTSRPGGGGSSIATYIRGIGTGDYNIPTDPAVGIYVDGVYLARSVGGLLSLTDIEQVQVLNGPQGTLYGRNTLGGAILITTRKPLLTGAPKFEVGTRLGSYGRHDGWGYVNAPLVDDKVGVKLSVATLNSDGWARQLLTGRSLSDEHRIVVTGGLEFALADDLGLLIEGDYTHQRQHPPLVAGVSLTSPPARLAQYNSLVAPGVDAQLGLPAGSVLDQRWLSPDYRSSYSTAPVYDNNDLGGVSAHLTYSPSPAAEITSISAYRKLKAEISVTSDSTPYNVFLSGTVFRDNQVSQEVTVGGKLADNKLNYLVGGYYFHEHGTTNDSAQIFHGLYEAGGGRANALDTLTLQDLHEESWAFFTQETLTVLPRLNLTVGGRLNHDQKTYTGSVLQPQLGTVGVPATTADIGWTSFIPKVGIDWKPVDEVLIYASYAKGFKSGGVTTPLLGLPASGYAPEKLTTYEAGLKSTLLDRRVTFNAAGYISRYRDVQLTSVVALPGGGSGRPTQNAGNAHIWGLEAQLDVRPMRGLTLSASGGYVHDRFSYLLPGTVSALGSQVGDRLPQVPDFNASAGGDYRFDLAGGTVALHADTRVTGKAQLTAGDVASFQPIYTLIDLGVSFSPALLRGLELAVRGTNVNDSRYVVFSSRSPSTGIRAVIPGAPATWFFSGTFRF